MAKETESTESPAAKADPIVEFLVATGKSLAVALTMAGCLNESKRGEVETALSDPETKHKAASLIGEAVNRAIKKRKGDRIKGKKPTAE